MTRADDRRRRQVPGLARRIGRHLFGGRHPARAVAFGFLAAIVLGTVVLMLPMASEKGTVTGLLPALFTATSAVCVTGLTVTDTPTYWSTFGELVILGLVQIGGLGIMTVASLLGLLISRRLGLGMQLTAQAETKTLGLGEVRRVIGRIIGTSLVIEAVIAVVLTLRLAYGYQQPWPLAWYEGIFHAVSAFNSGGFAIRSDSMIGFATDPWICLPLALAVITGGVGFPVLFEVSRRLAGRGRKRWSVHSKMTLLGTGVLLVFAMVVITTVEWTNPLTLGQYNPVGRVVVGFFQSVMPRSGGFNSVDVGELRPASMLAMDVLMFIGGGSAGTAGGIKVTTFMLLAFVILAEIRGEPTVHVTDRRLPVSVQRQALTIVLLGLGAVVSATLIMLTITRHSLEDVLFEVTSAFGTVGLSTGLTADLPPAGHVVLMLLGRLGPITLATALALRERGRRYELPEERPIVG